MTRDGKEIEIKEFGLKIHVDSLKNGREYRENRYSYNHFKLSIDEGILRYYRISGGRGGSGEISAIGTKQ